MTNYGYLWPYALASFLHYGFIGCFISYLALYLAGRGFDSFEIGAVFAIYTLGRVALGQIVAYLSDLHQDQLSFYRLGLIGACALLIPCLFLTASYLFLFLIILSLSCFMSIASQIELLCLDATIGDSKIYNRVRLCGSLGFVVCAIFMGKLLDKYSPSVVIYSGITVLILGYASSFKMRNIRCYLKEKVAMTGFYKKCLSPVFIAFLLASILLHISFAPFVGFFTQYLAINGYIGIEIGILFSLGAMAEMILFFYAGAILFQFSVRTLLLFGLLITSCRWFLQGLYIDNLTIAIITQCLHAFSFGLMHSVSVHFLRHYFGPTQQGRGQFMYFGAAFGLGTALGSLITGITWKEGMGSELTFTWAALACLLGAIIIWIVPNKQFVASIAVNSESR